MLTFCLLTLTLCGQAPAPSYRYEPVSPPAGPGATLYTDGDKATPGVVTVDVFACHELHKAIAARDKVGFEELYTAGRAFALEPGTELKVLRYEKVLTGEPAYETRVVDGKHKNKKAWIFAYWARQRVEAAAVEPQPKAKARRRRR